MYDADGVGKGSGRSQPGMNLGRAVQAAWNEGLLIAGGGHAMAAGLTVAADRIDELRAFLNERRIRVSKRTMLREALVSTGFPYRPGDNLKQYMAMLGDVMQRTSGVRRPGAAAV